MPMTLGLYKVTPTNNIDTAAEASCDFYNSWSKWTLGSRGNNWVGIGNERSVDTIEQTNIVGTEGIEMPVGTGPDILTF